MLWDSLLDPAGGEASHTWSASFTAPPDLLAELCSTHFSLNEQGTQTDMQQVKLTSAGTAA